MAFGNFKTSTPTSLGDGNSHMKYVHTKLSSKLIFKWLLRISKHPLLLHWAMEILIWNMYILNWVASWFLSGFWEFQNIHFYITGRWRFSCEICTYQIENRQFWQMAHHWSYYVWKCLEPPAEGKSIEFPRKHAILADCTPLIGQWKFSYKICTYSIE